MIAQRGTKPLPKGFVFQLARGTAYPLEGLGFIRRARLWGLASAAAVINAVLLAALIAFTLAFVAPIVSGWVRYIEGLAGGEGFLAGLAAAAGWLLWVLAVGAVVAANALVLMLVGQVVASPFLDLLSERIETLVLGTRPEPLSIRRVLAAFSMALGDLFWSLVYWAVGSGILALVSALLLPAGGLGALGGVAGFLFSALLLAQEFVGLSAARRLVPFRARWRMLRGNRGLAMGFGSACMLLFAVPGLNLLLLPLAAAGGTLLYCDLSAAGRLGAGAAVGSRRAGVNGAA